MYVNYETYVDYGMADIEESAYPKLSALADSMIDHVTLDRVGNAVKDGVTLPDNVIVAYCAIVDQIPQIVAERKGERVSSFSNGVNSFSFDLTVKEIDRIIDSVLWLLPVEWCNVVSSEHGKYPHAG